MALDIDTFAQAAIPLDDGSWVAAKVVRTAEIIKDFFPNLEVRWLPKDKRAIDSDAFMIVEKCADGAELVAFTVRDESEFDERILERIIRADITKQKNGPTGILEDIDAHNASVKLMQAKQKQDALDEVKELSTSILGSPLNRYQHDGYRYDLPEHLQPTKEIFDVGIRHTKKG